MSVSGKNVMSTSKTELINREIGNNISRLLEINKVSQIELAKAIGVSKTSISNWCNGQKIPRMDKLDKIAEYFGVDRASILGVAKAEGEANNLFVLSEILDLVPRMLKLPEFELKRIIAGTEVILKKNNV